MRIVELLLAGERSGPVLDVAIEAADSSDIAGVLELATHTDPDVRLAVTQTLPHVRGGGPPTSELVQTAVRLTGDPEPEGRNWACFALAQQWRDVDTAAVREALAARLDDEDHEARREALLGLAHRQDPRALPRVRAALSRSSGNIWRLELLAAGALSNPQLHDLVLQHEAGWDDDDEALPTADLVRRLTDPAGAGDEVLDGVAELYRRRAHGLPAGEFLGITAAVVGVIANLGVYFALHTLFRETSRFVAGPVDLQLPDLSTLRPLSLVIGLAAGTMIFRLGWPVLRTLGACALLGLAAALVGLTVT